MTRACRAAMIVTTMTTTRGHRRRATIPLWAAEHKVTDVLFFARTCVCILAGDRGARARKKKRKRAREIDTHTHIRSGISGANLRSFVGRLQTQLTSLVQGQAVLLFEQLGTSGRRRALLLPCCTFRNQSLLQLLPLFAKYSWGFWLVELVCMNIHFRQHASRHLQGVAETLKHLKHHV